MTPLTLLALAPPTFAREIAPIVYRSCAPCHRSGEVAPFTLTSYADAKKWAPMIASVTQKRLMPPWKAVKGHGDFVGNRSLSDLEIALVQRWAKAGAPSGDLKSAPPAPKPSPGWSLGPPDLVLEMPEAFELPADGPDVLRNFVLPTSLGENKMVGAIEFRPGNPKVVHHALVFLDNAKQARRLDARQAGPGYSSFGGPGFFPSGSLGGWAPGGTPQWLPDGVGRHFAKGSDVVLQVHYHPSGKPATRYVGGIALENWDIDIAPGEKRYRRTASYTLPVEADFLSVTPHMHLLGKEMRATATLPDGRTQPLVWIKDWDFRWQDTFVYRRPVRLPKGTRLSLESWHDNSAQNPWNPSSPPKRVVYGEGSNDEMSLCIFEVTTDRVQDLLTLIADDGRHRKILQRAIELTRKGGG